MAVGRECSPPRSVSKQPLGGEGAGDGLRSCTADTRCGSGRCAACPLSALPASLPGVALPIYAQSACRGQRDVMRGPPGRRSPLATRKSWRPGAGRSGGGVRARDAQPRGGLRAHPQPEAPGGGSAAPVSQRPTHHDPAGGVRAGQASQLLHQLHHEPPHEPPHEPHHVVAGGPHPRAAAGRAAARKLRNGRCRPCGVGQPLHPPQAGRPPAESVSHGAGPRVRAVRTAPPRGSGVHQHPGGGIPAALRRTHGGAHPPRASRGGAGGDPMPAGRRA